jgi:hypothetical protein
MDNESIILFIWYAMRILASGEGTTEFGRKASKARDETLCYSLVVMPTSVAAFNDVEEICVSVALCTG